MNVGQLCQQLWRVGRGGGGGIKSTGTEKRKRKKKRKGKSKRFNGIVLFEGYTSGLIIEEKHKL